VEREGGCQTEVAAATERSSCRDSDWGASRPMDRRDLVARFRFALLAIFQSTRAGLGPP